MEDEKSYKILKKMSITQEKDDKTKDALLKQVYTGIAGAVGASSFGIGAGLISAGLAIPGALAVGAGVAAVGVGAYNLIGVIKSLRDRKKADNELKAYDAQLKEEEMAEGMGMSL